MGRKPIVVVGAGGHAAVIIELLRAGANYDPVLALDPHADADEVLDVRVLADDSNLEPLLRQGLSDAVIAIGANDLRQKLGLRFAAAGFSLPPIVHPSADVSPSAIIGQGVVIMARAHIGARARIGDLAVINTAAIVEHDGVIGAAAHVAPGVALGGCVSIGDRTLVGIGSAARPGSRVGADAIVGAGSTVVGAIVDGAKVGGCPARPLRR